MPCLARSDKDVQSGVEQFVSCENSMSVVQSSQGVLKPVSDELLSEPVIVCRLALATLRNKSVINWNKYMSGYDAIRDDIEKIITGFENYNSRVREPGGFYLPNCNREGKFDTLTRKAAFNIAGILPNDLHPGEFMMMTIRSHDQFNTTVYSLNDRYRGIYNERRVILMNHADMNNHGLKNGDVVDLHNNHEGVERVAHRFIVVEYSIPQGCTATYFPETNVLVPITSVADKSNTPTSKLVIITIKKL